MPEAMTDPVVFLEAALGRVEELARAAGSGGIEAVDYLWGTKYLNVRQPDGGISHTTEFSAELANHFAEHSPAAVLRRVAADRQILAEHKPVKAVGYDGYGVAVIDTCILCGSQYAPYPCRTVRLLAQAWGWEEAA
jgi:hypothetical protein